MPKTGETLFMVMEDGNWKITKYPNQWREQGYFVMELYVVTASETHTAW